MKMEMAWALVVLLVATPAMGADSDAEVEQLRRELRAVRDEVSTLRRAIFEIAESDRRRAADLANVLSSNASTSAPSLPSRNKKRKRRGKAPPPKPNEAVKANLASDDSISERTADRAAGRVAGQVEVPAGEPAAYVYVQDLRARPVRNKTVDIDQRGKQFVPSWAVVRLGTVVNFPNQDNIYHNVFSRTKGTNFDLGLYRRGDNAKGHRFLQPGPVDVYCNIHPRMAARILVVPNRHFTKVNPDGSFSLEKIPVGDRVIAAWSPGSKLSTLRIRVKAGRSTKAVLRLEQRASAHLNKHNQPYGSYP